MPHSHVLNLTMHMVTTIRFIIVLYSDYRKYRQILKLDTSTMTSMVYYGQWKDCNFSHGLCLLS
jgi:hypothetical protein